MQRSRSSADHQIPVIAADSESKRAFIKHGRIQILRLTPSLFSAPQHTAEPATAPDRTTRAARHHTPWRAAC